MKRPEKIGTMDKTETALTKRSEDIVIARLHEAEVALQKADTAQKAKLVKDVAAAQEVFATRQKLSEECIGYAHAIKIHALARLGELLAAMPKAKGMCGKLPPGPGRGRKRENGGSDLEPPFSTVPTLNDLGISKKESSIAQQLASLDQETRDSIARREQTIASARREQKAEAVKKSISLPDAKYRVLYADPPWSYRDKVDDGAIQSGGAERHYPTMSIDELCAMPVKTLCENDAVLFLWVTSPLLFDVKPVIEAWGFRYKAAFVWDKVKHNMGHYNSVRHEFLLICTRGSCTPDNFKLFDSVQTVERTKHSEKPAVFREIINTLYPNGKRIELFARQSVDGWDSYGYEAKHHADIGGSRDQ